MHAAVRPPCEAVLARELDDPYSMLVDPDSQAVAGEAAYRAHCCSSCQLRAGGRTTKMAEALSEGAHQGLLKKIN